MLNFLPNDQKKYKSTKMIKMLSLLFVELEMIIFLQSLKFVVWTQNTAAAFLLQHCELTMFEQKCILRALSEFTDFIVKISKADHCCTMVLKRENPV